jgi:hypothetical protein
MYANHFRKLASLVARRMALITRTLITTPFTLNLRIFLPFTKLCPQSLPISLSLLDLAMFTESTSLAMSNFTQNSLASTRSMSRMPLELRRTSQSSWFSTVDPVLRSRSLLMPLVTELSRSTLTPISSGPTSLVSEITSSKRRTTS